MADKLIDPTLEFCGLKKGKKNALLKPFTREANINYRVNTLNKLAY